MIVASSWPGFSYLNCNDFIEIYITVLVIHFLCFDVDTSWNKNTAHKTILTNHEKSGAQSSSYTVQMHRSR